MRSDVVVIVSPEGQLAASIVYCVEDLLVEQLVAQAAVEAFDEAILLRFSRCDINAPRNQASALVDLGLRDCFRTIK